MKLGLSPHCYNYYNSYKKLVSHVGAVIVLISSLLFLTISNESQTIQLNYNTYKTELVWAECVHYALPNAVETTNTVSSLSLFLSSMCLIFSQNEFTSPALWNPSGKKRWKRRWKRKNVSQQKDKNMAERIAADGVEKKTF